MTTMTKTREEREELLANVAAVVRQSERPLDQRDIRCTLSFSRAASAQVSSAIQTLLRRGVLVKAGTRWGRQTSYLHKDIAERQHQEWLATVPSVDQVQARIRLHCDHLLSAAESMTPSERASTVRQLARHFPLPGSEEE